MTFQNNFLIKFYGKLFIICSAILLILTTTTFTSHLSAQKIPKLLIKNAKNDSQIIIDESYYLKVYSRKDGKASITKGKIIYVDSQFLYINHAVPVKLKEITTINYVSNNLLKTRHFLKVILILIGILGIAFLSFILAFVGNNITAGLVWLLLPLIILFASNIVPYQKILIEQGWALSPLIQP